MRNRVPRKLARAGLAVGALALLSVSSAHASGGEITRGEMIAKSCFTCHGEEGRGAKTMPRIRGFSPDGLVERLKAFREGEKDVTVMDRHISGYTDEQLRDVAEYLAEMD